MPDDDRSYYYRRAEIELKAAQYATHPKAVNAHYLLAGPYLDLVYNPANGVSTLPEEPPAPADDLNGRQREARG